MTHHQATAHAELQRNVEDLCDKLGLLWHHDVDGRLSRGTKGFPDLVIAGSRGLVFAELKSEDDDTTAEQDAWGWTLTRAWQAMGGQSPPHPFGWVVWRPADWPNIRSALESIA